MKPETIIEELGAQFDELRRSPSDGYYTAYLIDGRRCRAKTVREAMEQLADLIIPNDN